MNPNENETYDAIVIGAGANGSWAATLLADAGLRVLILEAGGEAAPSLVSDAEFVIPTPARAFTAFTEFPYDTPPNRPFEWKRVRAVGGRTLLWNRVTPRLSDWEFKSASLDGYGMDWPLSHEELAPFYCAAEKYFGVHGNRDGLKQVPDGDFFPAAPMTATDLIFKSAVERSFPERQVVASRGIPLAAPWKGGIAPLTTLERLRSHPKVTVLANTVVIGITLKSDGSAANRVRACDRKSVETREYSAKLFFLCASTIESTRLLLNSVSNRFPNGLGNRDDRLGRGLMDHLISSIAAFIPMSSRSRQKKIFSGGPHSLMIPRFRNLTPGKLPFLRGYGMTAYLQRSPWDRYCNPLGYATCRLVGYGEVLSRPENRLTIDRNQRDRFGLPRLNIDCAWGENEKKMAEDMRSTMREMIRAIGGTIVREEPQLSLPGTATHEVGSAPMGNDPLTSILNPYQQIWGVPNVFVADGAAWPSAGWQPPTLTMLALTGRCCENAIARLRSGELG